MFSKAVPIAAGFARPVVISSRTTQGATVRVRAPRAKLDTKGRGLRRVECWMHPMQDGSQWK